MPLLTLNQYLTTFVCRDLQRSVDGRVLKVRVLTDLRLFNEAFITLQRLLHGERLPQTGDSHFRQTESKMSSLKFNTSKPITEPVNLRVSDPLFTSRIQPKTCPFCDREICFRTVEPDRRSFSHRMNRLRPLTSLKHFLYCMKNVLSQILVLLALVVKTSSIV